MRAYQSDDTFFAYRIVMRALLSTQARIPENPRTRLEGTYASTRSGHVLTRMRPADEIGQRMILEALGRHATLLEDPINI